MIWIIVSCIALYILYCLAFIVFQRYFIFRPQKLTDSYVFNAATAFREINIEANDHTRLNGFLLQPQATKGIIIYFHGNWKNLDNYLPFTKKVTYLCFSVLLPDYRSFGKSGGRLTEQNFYADTELWFAVARQYFDENKILIYGRSLGTTAAACLAARQQCHQLILETPFANMYDIGRRFGMLLPDGNYLSFGFRTDLFLQSVKVPILILHGNKDETVSIHSGKKLKQYLKPGDRFVEIENGKHKNLHQFETYHDALNDFLAAGR